MTRLRSPFGAELNLRSQFLFLDPPPEQPRDVVTATLSWHYRYLHESSHWARYHGSSIGILLTLLRRTRDTLAAHLLGQMSREQTAAASAVRKAGRRLLSFDGDVLGQLVDYELAVLGRDWLDLLSTYQTLLESDAAGIPASEARERCDAVTRGLFLTWHQSAGRGMIDCPVPDLAVTGAPIIAHVGGERLTTRLLFECAAVLDELYPQALGSLRRVVDRSLLRMLGVTFDGLYGMPYRIAKRLAGRDVGPVVVHALIDFALNPVVPGLHPGVSSVNWAELDPPSRFLIAAMSLEHRRVDLEDSWPTLEAVRSCYQQWEAETGLRFGKVDVTLTDFATLRQAAGAHVHVTEMLPNATLVYAARLLRERGESLYTISHFGLNFVGEGALRFVNPDSWWTEGNWWLFPPLRVIEDEYCWPSEHLGQDEATQLFIGSAVSAAFDDILHDVGPLQANHLSQHFLRQPGELAALNEMLRAVAKLDISWGR